jgi:hypothetical protein
MSASIPGFEKSAIGNCSKVKRAMHLLKTVITNNNENVVMVFLTNIIAP